MFRLKTRQRIEALGQNGYDSVNTLAMRRALVLTDETAGNAFLATLPPHIRTGKAPVRARSGFRITAKDTREFLMAYCACFLAVSAFIL
ncbi:MAG: hypothetical protein WA908_01225 [Pontixanthobacter sp.]